MCELDVETAAGKYELCGEGHRISMDLILYQCLEGFCVGVHFGFMCVSENCWCNCE